MKPESERKRALEWDDLKPDDYILVTWYNAIYLWETRRMTKADFRMFNLKNHVVSIQLCFSNQEPLDLDEVAKHFDDMDVETMLQKFGDLLIGEHHRMNVVSQAAHSLYSSVELPDDFDDWFLTIQPVLDGYLESADTLTDGRTFP